MESNEKNGERVINIFTAYNQNKKVVSINLDEVAFWEEDVDKSFTVVHLKNPTDIIWIKVDEETFRKKYIEYKTLYK